MLKVYRNKNYIHGSQTDYLLPKEYLIDKSYFLKAVKINKIEENCFNYLSWLSKKEYDEYLTYRNRKRQLEWLSARIASKKLLKEKKLIANYTQGEVLKNKLGAPFITNNEDLFISISHSHNMAMVAIASHPIGIDIEYIEPRRQSLCQLFFSSEELSYISKLDEYDKTLAINRIWTYKEAVSKVLGLGGRMNFKQINSIDNNYKDPITHLLIKCRSITVSNYIISIAHGTKEDKGKL